MAEREPQSPSLLALLKSLIASLVDLQSVFQRDTALDTSTDSSAGEPALPLALPAPEAHFEDAQLLTQHTPGWHIPHPSHLPIPTYAPAMTAFGIVFIALGAVTVWPLSVIGAMIFALAIAKWIGELLHD